MIADCNVRKVRATEILKTLKVNDRSVQRFVDFNVVPFFVKGEIVQMPGYIKNMIRDLEQDRNYTCFAVLQESLSFGETLNFLLVTENTEDWNFEFISHINVSWCYSYVFNKTYQHFSEYESIAVNSYYGVLRRLG